MTYLHKDHKPIISIWNVGLYKITRLSSVKFSLVLNQKSNQNGYIGDNKLNIMLSATKVWPNITKSQRVGTAGTFRSSKFM